MARYRRNLLTVGWVTVVLGALHLADHAGVVLSAFGLLFWDCHLAVEAGPRRGRMRACGCLLKLSMRVGRFVSSTGTVRSHATTIDRSGHRSKQVPRRSRAIGFTKNFVKVAASTRR
jgi:hypothetical protein